MSLPALPQRRAGRHGDDVVTRLASLLVAVSAAATLALPSASLAQATASPGPGLTYKSLRDGTGASPTAADAVRVYYRGTLMDGTEFDSSYKRGEPAKFPLSRVIPCWTQGVQKLHVGEKARLVCPPATAYGEAGIRGVIPPNSTLDFEVELIAIE